MALVVARRVVLGWLGGLGLAVLVGVPAEAGKRRKRGVYVDNYVDRYA
jgi:hypothetical protein